MKQIILVRTDLPEMGPGKMVAQGAHASMRPLISIFQEVQSKPVDEKLKDRLYDWICGEGGFTKVCLAVHSGEELLGLIEKAKAAGLPAYTIIDEGRTCFNGVATLTCGSIGPGTAEELDLITGHLELLP